MKISIISVNWFAQDFAKIQSKSIRNMSSGLNEVEHIIVDNSGSMDFRDDIWDVEIVRTNRNVGHGVGIDMGVKLSEGEYILILDIDAHILLKDWDVKLLEIFKNPEIKLACATDGGLLKPARPLAMFFKKSDIVDNNISFQAVNHDGVKFDVGLHAYFKLLSIYGDKCIFKLPSAKTQFENVLGNEYTLNGERFVYHNWWGTRWYNSEGKVVHSKIDNIEYKDFKIKKNNLFKQL